jgi:hypothetical protein
MGNSQAAKDTLSPKPTTVTELQENDELLGNGASYNNTGKESTNQANNELLEKYADLLKNYPPVGYRVLGVQSNSPASFTGLVAYFDFIIAANNVPLKAIDTTFIGLIQVSSSSCMFVSFSLYLSNRLRRKNLLR